MSTVVLPPWVVAPTAYLIATTQRAAQAHLDQRLRSRGLNVSQLRMLAAIFRSPGTSNAALARAVAMTPQTTQALIARLEDLGLVERQGDPDHGRVLRTQLTAKGTAFWQWGQGQVKQTERQMIRNLSDGERKIFHELIWRVLGNVRSPTRMARTGQSKRATKSLPVDRARPTR